MVRTSTHQFPRPLLLIACVQRCDLKNVWSQNVYLVLTSHVVSEQTGSKRVVQELSRSERSKKRALRNQIS